MKKEEMVKYQKEYQKEYRKKNKAREKVRKAIWWAKKRIKLGKNTEKNQAKLYKLEALLNEIDSKKFMKRKQMEKNKNFEMYIRKAKENFDGSFCVALTDYYFTNMIWLEKNKIIVKVRRNMTLIDYPETIKVSLSVFNLLGEEDKIKFHATLEKTKFFNYISYVSEPVEEEKIKKVLYATRCIAKSSLFNFRAMGVEYL